MMKGIHFICLKLKMEKILYLKLNGTRDLDNRELRERISLRIFGYGIITANWKGDMRAV